MLALRASHCFSTLGHGSAATRKSVVFYTGRDAPRGGGAPPDKSLSGEISECSHLFILMLVLVLMLVALLVGVVGLVA